MTARPAAADLPRGSGDAPGRMVEERWEHGSDFHYLSAATAEARAGLPLGMLVGSGRAALQILLEHGRNQRGWRRLWLPTYFCQEVVAALLGWGEEVVLYHDGPTNRTALLPVEELRAGDVILVVNFFGLREQAPVLPHLPDGVEVIEDHTHDPWSAWAGRSDAAWCMASLRKTLPLPDGGILWSPRGLRLPSVPPAAEAHEARSAERLAAMALKTLYLTGGAVEKQTFRELYLRSEGRMNEGAPSAISSYAEEILSHFAAEDWRARRRRNHKVLENELEGLRGAALLTVPTQAVPYAAMLRVDEADDRAVLKAILIRERIYPAVLWSLEEPLLPGIPDEHVHLSRQLLALHCDGRYDESDMLRVARTVRTAFS